MFKDELKWIQLVYLIMVEFSMNLEFWSLWDIDKRNEYSYIINLGKHGTNGELMKLR